ncbi:MAG TPA: EF-P beta-lysylation protein EpmB, partial [Planctomycetaceae bacterium]|nr:EF-P beta-lysylation protein EpmB [Planctomycetaceae bacterium]
MLNRTNATGREQRAPAALGNPQAASDQPSACSRPASWQQALSMAVRDPAELIRELGLPTELIEGAARAARRFPLLVPRSYLERMRPGDPSDPLLRQILPVAAETSPLPGFTPDPVGDRAARKAPGLLQKYRGRALLITTGACPVHCRYCFRREYPYSEEPRRMQDWQAAWDCIRSDASLREIILSGGDPLMLPDERLAGLIGQLAEIPHLRRLRLHTRMPVVLPERVTCELIDVLRATPLRTIVVVHANHPQELRRDCADALKRLVGAGLVTLNQAVLLRGINDTVETLASLCERLIDLGVIPYYLHQLDRVVGAGHFEVPEPDGRQMLRELRRRLPGYAVPRYVRELAGAERLLTSAVKRVDQAVYTAITQAVQGKLRGGVLRFDLTD